MDKLKNESSNEDVAATQDETKPFKYSSVGVYHWIIVLLVNYFIGNLPILTILYFGLHNSLIDCMMDVERKDAKQSGRRASFRNILAMQCLPQVYVAVPTVHIFILLIQNYPAQSFAGPKYIPTAFCHYPWAVLVATGLVFAAARGVPDARRAFRRNVLTSFYRVVFCGDLIDLIRNHVQGWSGGKLAVSAPHEKLQATAEEA